jgi:hypothetical protein
MLWAKQTNTGRVLRLLSSDILLLDKPCRKKELAKYFELSYTPFGGSKEGLGMALLHGKLRGSKPLRLIQ